MNLFPTKYLLGVGVLALTAVGSVSAAPIPDIKANGSDGPLTIPPDERLQVTVVLDAGTSVGVDADWWVLAETPGGWYHYDQVDWTPGLKVTYQGQLVDLPETDVLDASGLPIGQYKVYFGVDVVKNGKIDMAAGYYDSIDISIFKLTPLNDTGITWGGSYPSGNNATCTSNGTIAAPQDCDFGRDAEAAAGTLDKIGAGHGGFDFTKLDADGDELPASASNWACVRDNHTGLTWEVKTGDGGIHDKDNTYRWGGKTALGRRYGTYYTDWNTLVDGTNNEALCGLTGWRVPTVEELEGLLSLNRVTPAIDVVYFPNTPSAYFWTASPYATTPDTAWYVYFYYGSADDSLRSSYLRVRLVNSGN